MNRRNLLKAVSAAALVAAVPMPATAVNHAEAFRKEVFNIFISEQDVDRRLKAITNSCLRYRELLEVHMMNQYGRERTMDIWYWNDDTQTYWCIKLEQINTEPKSLIRFSENLLGMPEDRLWREIRLRPLLM